MYISIYLTNNEQIFLDNNIITSHVTCNLGDCKFDFGLIEIGE